MAKLRRGNFIFLTWKGDHSPRHVHVYNDRKLILKWNLDDEQPMMGRPNARVLRLLAQLKKEGLL